MFLLIWLHLRPNGSLGLLKKNEQSSSSFVPTGGQVGLNLVKAAADDWQYKAVRH
jgi:hypothetical protein